MTVQDLNREQLQQVKVNYYTNDCNEPDGPLSYGEILDIDNIISDREVCEAYAGIDFVEDDFFH